MSRSIGASLNTALQDGCFGPLGFRSPEYPRLRRVLIFEISELNRCARSYSDVKAFHLSFVAKSRGSRNGCPRMGGIPVSIRFVVSCSVEMFHSRAWFSELNSPRKSRDRIRGAKAIPLPSPADWSWRGNRRLDVEFMDLGRWAGTGTRPHFGDTRSSGCRRFRECHDCRRASIPKTASFLQAPMGRGEVDRRGGRKRRRGPAWPKP